MASTITGLEVSTWTTVASRDVGLVVWSVALDNVGQLEAANGRLAESGEYGDWVDAHDHLFDGTTEDSLIQVMHSAIDPQRSVNVVFISTAVCANGKMAAAMQAGVEFAETITKISGLPTSFATTVTGAYGGVVWLGGAENMSEMEHGLSALNTDPSFVALVDQHGASFQPGTDVAWYQRLS